MKMKHGKFSTFLFSLIPGAGEMYLGFFKYGTSLMSLFIGSIIFSSMVFSPLILIAFVVWFYSFFHTNNINHMPDKEFEKLEDTYLFSFFNDNDFRDFIHNNKTLCSIICILIGIIILCYTFIDAFLLMIPDEFYYHISHILHTFLPKIFFGVICILFGYILIRREKVSLLQELEHISDSDIDTNVDTDIDIHTNMNMDINTDNSINDINSFDYANTSTKETSFQWTEKITKNASEIKTMTSFENSNFKKNE